MTIDRYDYRKVSLNDGSSYFLIYDDDRYVGHVEQPLGGWAFYSDEGLLVAVGNSRDEAVRLGTRRG
jgi:hypothetical protein